MEGGGRSDLLVVAIWILHPLEIGQFPNVQRETASVPAGVKASQYTSGEELRIRKN